MSVDIADILENVYLAATGAHYEARWDTSVVVYLSPELVEELQAPARRPYRKITSDSAQSIFGYPVIVQKHWTGVRAEVHAITRIAT